MARRVSVRAARGVADRHRQSLALRVRKKHIKFSIEEAKRQGVQWDKNGAVDYGKKP